MPTDWYPNEDEQDRAPTPVTAGLKFEGNDLIHHATSGNLDTLTHGTFAAAPAPDQPSFFSVEVSGADGKYGTLRWNTQESSWEATSQGEQHHDTDPAALADVFPLHLSHHVVSFGVGYTANPPGTVTTVVSSVTFAGKTYDLTCKPPVTATASPSPSATHASPSASVKPHITTPSPSRSAVAAAGLPVTGPPTAWILIAAAALVSLGGLAIFLVRACQPPRFTP
jgi:hypothetical protein